MSAPSDLLLASRAGRVAAPATAFPLAAGPDRDVLASSALLALATAAQPSAPLEAKAAEPKPKINPSKRVLRFIVPVTDGTSYLGDVELAVDPDDRLSVKAERLFQLLEPILKPDIVERLKASAGTKDEITEAELSAESVELSYDSEKLALAIAIPVSARRTSILSLRSGLDPAAESLDPAGVSAFLNFRSAMDLVEKGGDKGLSAPVTLLDGAVRAGGVVAEGEAYLSLRKDEPLFRRTGSRLVYDDLKNIIRFSAGDVRPFVRSFQSTPTVAGILATRSYTILEPWREFRSMGAQSFTLLGPSSVETIVNGRSVERRLLQPGSYNLSDFPLAEGSNDVKLRIEDETGRQRTIEFNLYSNRQLLEPGATEFSVFAGVYSNPTSSGIHYSKDWNVSGFVRRGLTQQVSAGVNVQADRNARQAGIELLFGTSLGLIGFDLAASHRAAGGGNATGFAIAGIYEKIIDSSGSGRSQSIRASIDYRSPRFALPGALLAREPAALRASLGYALTLGLDKFIALDAAYSRDRVERRRRYSLRASGGFRIGDTLAALGEVEWGRTSTNGGFVARIGIRKRFGARTTAQIDADTRGTVRSLYQSSGGRGIGAWTGSVDFARTSLGTTLNANGSLLTNRAEFSVNQLAAYDPDRKTIDTIRTSFRAATSIAFADGAFAIGRPVQEAFLIAGPHRSLKGAPVRLDPAEKSADASSGTLGKALEGSLSAYSPRLLVYEVPSAPAGYDLGAGNVQIVPPYKAGYRLEIGSDYHLLVVGRLLDRNGEPVALLAGKAIDVKAPRRAAITMFTSRSGKFGAQGLRPGKWRIEMPTEGSPTIYEIDIKDDPSGTVRLGDIRPRDRGGLQ